MCLESSLVGLLPLPLIAFLRVCAPNTRFRHSPSTFAEKEAVTHRPMYMYMLLLLSIAQVHFLLP